ncbi:MULTISPECIES: tetratricopeptide repeat protein [unclassified Saccharicrinis]|uniref:tetratricopeptide repeat protein n=1 Tax=unclassified Saccharicrinis TaxID=2646859 RepID=UPI003D354788
MKKLLIYIIVLAAAASAYAQDNRFEDANNLFTEGKYEEAITSYNEIINTGVESAKLYYNLGNAYYKSGNLPRAILNYERALLLAPHDKDIRYNLEMSNMQITDKLETVGEFFLATWFKNFKSKTKSDTWALLSITAFCISILGIGLFLFSRKRSIKQVSFAAGIILFVVAFIAFNFSASQKDKLINRDTAIVFEPSVSVKSSPSAGGTDLFILHEGTKVNILEELGEWKRIVISDGNEGWMPAAAIEVI